MTQLRDLDPIANPRGGLFLRHHHLVHLRRLHRLLWHFRPRRIAVAAG